jgi:hypothetical protein
MSERSAERTAHRAPVRSTDSTGTTEETTGRTPLSDRIQSKLARAAEEHRRNADAPSKSMGRQRRAASGREGRRAPRRARLRLTRIDPWSVMKTSFLLSVAFGIVTVVSVFIVWTVLGGAGVWDSINATVEDVLGSEAGNFDVTDYISTSRVLGFTMLVAVVDVVLMTAIATLTAFLYNMAGALLGGIEVTLAEDN